MNMKKINVIMVAALAGLSLSLTGCSEDFLDQKPKGVNIRPRPTTPPTRQ